MVKITVAEFNEDKTKYTEVYDIHLSSEAVHGFNEWIDKFLSTPDEDLNIKVTNDSQRKKS